MKKSLKVYLSAWGVVIAAFLISFVTGRILSGREAVMIERSKDPVQVERLLKIDLPAISSVESDDLTGSQYCEYMCYMYFAEPLAEEVIQELEKRCKTEADLWKKTTDFYYFSKKLTCYIYEDRAEISFTTVDDMPFVYFGVLFSFLGLPILLVWGLILGIISLVSKSRKTI